MWRRSHSRMSHITHGEARVLGGKRTEAANVEKISQSDESYHPWRGSLAFPDRRQRHNSKTPIFLLLSLSSLSLGWVDAFVVAVQLLTVQVYFHVGCFLVN
jgi:hypothetical protein